MPHKGLLDYEHDLKTMAAEGYDVEEPYLRRMLLHKSIQDVKLILEKRKLMWPKFRPEWEDAANQLAQQGCVEVRTKQKYLILLLRFAGDPDKVLAHLNMRKLAFQAHRLQEKNIDAHRTFIRKLQTEENEFRKVKLKDVASICKKFSSAGGSEVFENKVRDLLRKRRLFREANCQKVQNPDWVDAIKSVLQNPIVAGTARRKIVRLSNKHEGDANLVLFEVVRDVKNKLVTRRLKQIYQQLSAESFEELQNSLVRLDSAGLSDRPTNKRLLLALGVDQVVAAKDILLKHAAQQTVRKQERTRNESLMTDTSCDCLSHDEDDLSEAWSGDEEDASLFIKGKTEGNGRATPSLSSPVDHQETNIDIGEEEEAKVLAQHIKNNNGARIVVIIGPPGSGVSLQCQRILDSYDFFHVGSWADLEAIKVVENESGLHVAGKIQEFQQTRDPSLMPFLTPLIKSEVMRAVISGHTRILVEGFPMDQEGWVVWQKFIGLSDCDHLVINLDTPERVARQRCLARRDKPLILNARFDNYASRTVPLLQKMEGEPGLLHRISHGSVAEVHGKVIRIVNHFVNTPADVEVTLEQKVALEGQAENLRRATVIFVMGLPGCGKVTVCRRFSKESKFVHINMDLLQNSLLTLKPDSLHGKAITKARNSGTETPPGICISLLSTALGQEIKKGHLHFLVSHFPYSADSWQAWQSSIGQYAQVPAVVHLVCPEMECKRRLEEKGEAASAVELRLALYKDSTEAVIHNLFKQNMVTTLSSYHDAEAVYSNFKESMAPFDSSETDTPVVNSTAAAPSQEHELNTHLSTSLSHSNLHFILVNSSPASGATTQSQLIGQHYQLPRLDCKKMLDQKESDSEWAHLGQAANEITTSKRKHKFVPADICVHAVLTWCANSLPQNKQEKVTLLVDGFPRNREDWVQWNSAAAQLNIKTTFLFFETATPVSENRLKKLGLSTAVIAERMQDFRQNLRPLIDSCTSAGEVEVVPALKDTEDAKTMFHRAQYLLWELEDGHADLPGKYKLLTAPTQSFKVDSEERAAVVEFLSSKYCPLFVTKATPQPKPSALNVDRIVQESKTVTQAIAHLKQFVDSKVKFLSVEEIPPLIRLCQDARNSPKTPEVPIIVTTSMRKTVMEHLRASAKVLGYSNATKVTTREITLLISAAKSLPSLFTHLAKFEAVGMHFENVGSLIPFVTVIESNKRLES